jgi:hypothetical protein
LLNTHLKLKQTPYIHVLNIENHFTNQFKIRKKMKKRIALLSLAAIFAFATIATAQETTKKATEPTKKEVKTEKKAECKDTKKGECKGEKKSDCNKTEKKGCCGEKK